MDGYSNFQDDDRVENGEFILLLVEAENLSSGAPSTSDLESYANNAGFSGPVLADPAWGFGTAFELDYYIPTYSLLGGGLEVLKVDQYVMPGDITQAIDAL